MRLYLRHFIHFALKRVDYYHASINPTYLCNAKCPTCGVWQDRGSWKNREHEKMMTKETAEKIIKYPYRNVNITGGECTLWEHLSWFVNSGKWQKVRILTNGIDTDNIYQIAKDIKRKDVQWNVSLNGIGKIHDESKGIEGSFDKAITTIDNLKSLGYEVTCGYTPFKENMNNFMELYLFLARQKIKIDISFSSIRDKFEHFTWTQLSQEDLLKFYKLKINITGGIYGQAVDYFIDHVSRKKLMFCYGGLTFQSILPDGTFTPCPYRTDSIGNLDKGVDKKKLKPIWEGKCLYDSNGKVCGDCTLSNTIRRNIPKLIIWKIQNVFYNNASREKASKICL